MHVITGLELGGAEGMLSRLVTSGCDTGIEYLVISLVPGGPYRMFLEQGNVPVYDLGMRRGIPSLHAIAGLAGHIRSWQPHVIQTWLYHADLLSTVALKWSGRRKSTRLVWGIRCSELEFSDYSIFTKWAVGILAKLSRVPDAVMSNSEAGRRAHVALGYRPRAWILLPNAVDTERFRPDPAAREAVRRELALPEDAFVIGMCARVVAKKDHRTFVAAAASFVKNRTGVRFVLVGDGTAGGGTDLSRQVAAAGLSDLVVRTGPRNDVERLYAAFDVATLTSAYGEGFPNVLAEAMACGVPCATTDVGDARQVVGDTGVVVPARDVSALATSWSRLWSMPVTERKRLGAAARQRTAEKFSLHKILREYERVYAELAAELT